MNVKKPGVLLAVLLVAFVCPSFAQQRAEPRIRTLRIPLPLTEFSVSAAAMMWTNATGVPTGVEGLMRTAAETSAGRSRILSTLDLSGLTIKQSAEEIVQQLGDYQGRFADESLVLRPARRSPLDVVVPRFTLTQAGLLGAVEAVHQIFQPAYVIRATPVPPPAAGESAYAKELRDRYNEKFRPVITLDLTNATVETILIAIAKAYGGASWAVLYTSEDRRFEECVVTVFVPKGVSVSAGPQRAPAKGR